MRRKKALIVLVPSLLLLILSGINIYKKLIWEEPTDGITWESKPAGLTAVRVEEGSRGWMASIRVGDILLFINNEPVRNPIDVSKKIWEAYYGNVRVEYQYLREEPPAYTIRFNVEAVGTGLLYFFLALVGLTTLVIAGIVILKARHPFSLPYLFFYWVSLAFFVFHVFSPTGEMGLLDSLFFWLNKIGFLLFPPLLLHFFIIFPRRKKLFKEKLSTIYMMYFPAGVLMLAAIFLHFFDLLKISSNFTFHYYRTYEKLELLHFAIFSLVAFTMILNDTIKATSPLIKNQLKWIAYGLGFGVIPFTAAYVIPFTLGALPARAGELTVVLQALIPLTFAYSISRYKLIEIEVILKKAVTLIFSYLVIGLLYLIVSSQTNIFPDNRLQALILGILAIVLGATLFTPIKKLSLALIERAIYKRTYPYRRTLLSISADISRERDLQKLSHSILEHIANALSLQHVAMLLPIRGHRAVFSVFESRGKLPSDQNRITLEEGLFRFLKRDDYLSNYTLSERRDLQKKFSSLAELGFFHMMPLMVEDKMVGCLAMGKKTDNSQLSSADWELLRTISSSIALALENATLYNQAQIRAKELERLKDYSENIIESLTVGVAVIDPYGRIIGWNRVMEESFNRPKPEVMNKYLRDILGGQNFSALFPPDTQKDYRLLSEIGLTMPDGRSKIFDIAKTPLLDNLRNPYGTIIVFEDTTEKTSLQQQLMTSEKLASIGLLSAGVAHEINTPLTGISSYVQMLQKKLSETPYSQFLDKIEVQTDRVARIVKNLLNFSRGPSESMLHQVDLKDSLQGIVSLIEYKLKNLNIRLKMDIEPIKPVWAHGERIQQVFINIILNAIDAMQEGGALRIELTQENGEAIVRIRDTGTGIKSQHLPNIFDPFFTTKGIGKGTGLGLSISYAIVKEHEGRITVDSEVGKGTLFTISIPMDLEVKNKSKPLS